MANLKELNHGLKLLTVPMKNTDTVTVLVMVATGSKYETKENNGISHFFEHMYFKGTKKRPSALLISSELDSMGAEYNAFTTKEFTGYWIKSEKKNLAKMMEITGDLLNNATLAEAEIEREKGVIIEEINMYYDNPMSYAEDIFEHCLYGNTPAGWDVLGTKENILRFKREDFTKYLHAQYGSSNIIISVAGNFKQEQAEKFTNKYFLNKNIDNWGKDFSEKLKVVEHQTKPQLIVKYKDTDQAHLCLGVRTCDYTHPDRMITKIISIILGGSMSSRLFIELRERNGLGYYVVTQNEAYTDSGYIVTRAGVRKEEIAKAIKIILGEYKKITEKLVGQKELKKYKDLLRGRLALQLETSDDLAEWYGRQSILNHSIARAGQKERKIVTPDDYIKEIDKIGPADIKRVAKKIFVNAGLNFAVIGPYKEKNIFEKLLKI